jgi:hypothetical protein
MTAPTEEKLTSSTLQSSTLPTLVGGRERERRATDHFFGKCELINRETVCSLLKEPTLFLCSKKLGSLASETYTIGIQSSAVTLSKKRKQKKI